MKIVEYQAKYRDDLANLMYQLEKFFMDMDSMKKATVTDDYKTTYIDYTLDRVKKNQGKIYLAIEDDKVIGVVVCIIIPYNNVDATNYNFNKEGEVTELIIDQNYRGKSVGTKLINKVEEYFKSCGCDIVRISAFAENKKALEFYERKGYNIRNVDFIKKI